MARGHTAHAHLEARSEHERLRAGQGEGDRPTRRRHDLRDSRASLCALCDNAADVGERVAAPLSGRRAIDRAVRHPVVRRDHVFGPVRTGRSTCNEIREDDDAEGRGKGDNGDNGEGGAHRKSLKCCLHCHALFVRCVARTAVRACSPCTLPLCICMHGVLRCSACKNGLQTLNRACRPTRRGLHDEPVAAVLRKLACIPYLCVKICDIFQKFYFPKRQYVRRVRKVGCNAHRARSWSAQCWR